MCLRSRGVGGCVSKSTCMQNIKSRLLHINIKMANNTIKIDESTEKSLHKNRHMILKITVISKMKTNHNIIPLHTH